MKKYSILFLTLIFQHFTILGQTDDSSFLNKTEFKVGYYGNLLWDNGLNIGAEHIWKEKKKIKEKKKGQKTIVHQLLWNGNLGYSTNFTNKTDNGLSTYYGIIWRRTNPKRRQISVELNPLGYYRSFLPEAYEIKGGEVSKIGFPGRSYYAPSIAVGIGRARIDKRRSGWYLNLNCTLRTPYNAGTFPAITLQYGYRFNFKKKK